MSSFSADKFRAAKYEPRFDSVLIPALTDFFKQGDEPRFVVRGLTAAELHKSIEASHKNASIDNVVKALSTQKDQIEAIRKTLGLSSDVPGEIAKRIEMIVLGSVEPKLNHADAAKLAEVCPLEFFELSNKVTMLTGQGGSRVKPQPSSPKTPQ